MAIEYSKELLYVVGCWYSNNNDRTDYNTFLYGGIRLQSEYLSKVWREERDGVNRE